MSTAVLQRRRGSPTTTPSAAGGAVRSWRGFVPIIAVLIFWQVLGDEESLLFPPPSMSIATLGELELWSSIWLTLRTFVLGVAIATVAGVTLGALIGSSRLLDRASQPVMDFCRGLPGPVIVPVFALVIGPNLWAGLAILLFSCIWPVLLNTATGMRSVPQVRLAMARTMGLSTSGRIFKVVLPSLTPFVLVGLKISVVIGLLVTVYLEMMGVQQGIGYLLLQRQQQFDGAGVWGIVFLCAVGGYALNVGLEVAQRYLLRHWPERR